MNTYNLKGQVAVVTGGAQGIGFAVIERLYAAGAKIASWDINQDQNQSVVKNLSKDIHAEHCDVTDFSSVERALKNTENTFGPVTILVHSAGIAGVNEPIHSYDNNEWENVIKINLTGTYNVNKAIIKSMRDQNYGRIVNIASVAGKEGNPNAAAYSASKAGVIGFTKSAGKENADRNIAVNCVTPAAARTPIFDQMTETHISYMLSKIPRGRFVEVEEISNMIVWLVSVENSFSTGATFDISGGRATY
jgi:NAD(P)-dependent dehydrogenase (short-subunit alcohol dehydrogenase family)